MLLTACSKGPVTPVFREGTVVNHVNISGMTAQQAASALRSAWGTGTFILKLGQKQLPLDLSNVIPSVDFSEKTAALMEEGATGSMSINPEIEINKTALKAEIVRQVKEINQKLTPPSDAYFEFKDGRFTIVPEENGQQVDPEKIADAVMSRMEYGYSEYEIQPAEYIRPDVTSMNLKRTEEMKRIEDEPFILDLDGEQVEVPDSLWHSWITMEEDHSFSIDPEAVEEYVHNEIGTKYNTLGTQRTFKNHAGDLISVGGSPKDNYGYVLDESATIKAMIDGWLSGDPISAVFSLKGTRGDRNDIGSTYIEVSIQDQHAWYYVNGNVVWNTDVVTGTNYRGGTTPGVFKVLYKQSPSVLRGDDYEVNVDYWMPITASGTGFHDASWRLAFGGNIYKFDGSHGCINMPHDKAKTLYEMVAAGTPVVIY